MQCARHRLDVSRSPHEDDVDDGDGDEPRRDRPRRRDACDELCHRDRGKRDEHNGRRLRDEAVRLPGDDPQHGGERKPRAACDCKQRRPDGARPREPTRAAEPKGRDAADERGRRKQHTRK